MNILLASSEIHPFSKTGGLADMVSAMAKYLAQNGHRVGVVTPYYRAVRRQFPDIAPFDWKMDLPHGATRVEAKVRYLQTPDNLEFYFIQEANFFDREGLYQSEGVDYIDNADRFIFFSKCVTHLARYLPWKPEIVHAHDWQSGLVPLFIRYQSETEDWPQAPKTCLTIHNLAFQGNFPPEFYALTNLPDDYYHPQGIEFYGSFNCLKAGILFADAVTTVSRTYAQEILTKEYGCGLDGVLREQASKVTGILNGVDYEEWNTDQNPHLPAAFHVGDLRGKRSCKSSLQKEFKLPVKSNVPLFANISRLTHQKGNDLILKALDKALEEWDLQFVLLGNGDAVLEEGFRALSERFPEKVGVHIGYDSGQSHRIEAAADFYLMPSRFEPCGLNQLYSLRYGALPIVRRTGGLEDSIVDLVDEPQLGDGIKFVEPDVESLLGAMQRAVELFQNKRLLKQTRTNAMNANFSWEKSVQSYELVYRRLLSA